MVRPPKRDKPRKPKLRHRPAKQPPHTLTDGRQLHRIDGYWCAVELAPIPDGPPPDRDVVCGAGPRAFWQFWKALVETYGRPGVYGVRAERLGPKELRKLGLA